MESLSVQQFGAKSADPVSAPQAQSSPRSPWGRLIPPPLIPSPIPSSATQAAKGCDWTNFFSFPFLTIPFYFLRHYTLYNSLFYNRVIDLNYPFFLPAQI